ncbi:MAG: hypothetical protein K0R85_2322 [Devosia sp.]|nr:hypothetical protein [Devosia sp.]
MLRQLPREEGAINGTINQDAWEQRFDCWGSLAGIKLRNGRVGGKDGHAIGGKGCQHGRFACRDRAGKAKPIHAQ